jgi:flagellar assembly protein FliH
MPHEEAQSLQARPAFLGPPRAATVRPLRLPPLFTEAQSAGHAPADGQALPEAEVPPDPVPVVSLSERKDRSDRDEDRDSAHAVGTEPTSQAAGEPALAAGHQATVDLAAEQERPAPPEAPRDLERGAEMFALAIERLRSEVSRLAAEARADALAIGLALARRVLDREVRTDVEALLSLVRAAVEEARRDHVVEIRLAPEDLERVRAYLDAEPYAGQAIADLRLVADPDLGIGDCVVTTDYGEVDGRLETRLQRLWRTLEESEEARP